MAPAARQTAGGSQGEPQAMNRDQFREYITAFNADDWEGFSKFYAEDVILDLASNDARQLLFVLSGTGTAETARLTAHSAIRVDPGERIAIRSEDAIEALIFGLPPISKASASAAAA